MQYKPNSFSLPLALSLQALQKSKVSLSLSYKLLCIVKGCNKVSLQPPLYSEPPNSLSLPSQERCSTLLINFVASSGPVPTVMIFELKVFWGLQHNTSYSKHGKDSSFPSPKQCILLLFRKLQMRINEFVRRMNKLLVTLFLAVRARKHLEFLPSPLFYYTWLVKIQGQFFKSHCYIHCKKINFFSCSSQLGSVENH